MRNIRAFTLIETVIAVSIIAIFFFATIPVFSNFLGVLELKGGARKIVADLRAAQERAVALRASVAAEFQPKNLFGDAAAYVIKVKRPTSAKEEVVRRVKLSDKFDFDSPATIKFSKTGFPPAGGSGTIKLKYLGGRLMRIIVSSAGRIRME